MSIEVELLVIGAGTAGIRTAITAANSGADVVLVGDGELGGASLNTACLPSKTLLESARLYRKMQSLEAFGLRGSVDADYSQVVKHMKQLRAQGRVHAEQAVEQAPGLRYVPGRARFVSKNIVEVGQQRFVAQKIILATGSQPVIPSIPGLQDTQFYTSESIIELESLPKSMVIIGAGRVGCEFATLFASFGVRVTLVERSAAVAGFLDPDVSALVRSQLERLGVRVFVKTAVTSISEGDERVTCSLSGADKSRVSAQKLLVATGRSPNTDGLRLGVAGVAVNGSGAVVVNKFLRCSNPVVYAVGDVTGRSRFTHTARRESWLALENALMDSRQQLDYSRIPWVLSTPLLVAGVGRSERELRKAGVRFSVLEASCEFTARSQIAGSSGRVKVLHKKDRILGAVVIGEQADALIHELAALMHVPDGLRVLHTVVHAHPSFAEVFENLRPRE